MKSFISRLLTGDANKAPSLKTSMLLLFAIVGAGLLVVMIGMRLFVGYSHHVDAAYADLVRMERVLNEMSFENKHEMADLIEDLFPHWSVERPGDTATGDRLRRRVDVYGWPAIYVRMDVDYIWSSLLMENKVEFLAGVVALVLFLQIALTFAKNVTLSLQKIEIGVGEISSGSGARLPDSGYSVLELEKLRNRFNDAVAEMENWRDFEKKMERMERFAMMGEMASGVAHEIRNPMAAMKMQLDLMRTYSGGDPRFAELLDNMDEELMNLEVRVNSFIEFARYEPGGMFEIDPDELVARVIKDITPMTEARGVAVKVVSDAGSFGGENSFKGDPELLKQALMHLSVNAIQAMDGGGSLTLAVIVSVGRIIFTVDDTGGGVPKSIANRLFEPFVSGRPDGTGLGLATARKIVEDHNGTLSFVSSEKGSSFRMELPR